ncbi:MAG: 3-hydroxylacyl-ACP dehydratase [Elusimicrobia bacterium]|nr:3-hydroxylacyl-ACP dehydratase [Elusimicrobiota bacterium]
MDTLTPPVEARDVVPHSGRMVLLRRVISHDAQGTVCDAVLTPESMFLEDGEVPAWVGLEYMAQAVAAHAGMADRARGVGPSVGFLLGSRRVDIRTRGFTPGQTLHVSARRVWGEGELFVFDCSVQDAVTRRTLVAAQLNLYRPKEIERFLEESEL